MDINLIEAIIIILQIGIIAGLGYVVKKYGKENVDWVFFYAQIFVASVQQIAKRKGWTDEIKLEEAIKRLKKKFPELSEQELEDYIEAAYLKVIKSFEIIKEEYEEME